MMYCSFCFEETEYTFDIECENVQGKKVYKSLYFCDTHYPVMNAILAIPNFWGDVDDK